LGDYGKSAFGFEDLDVYQGACGFRRQVYDLAHSLPGREKYALAQQMTRAAISLTNNMAEGYGRYNWQETTQFFRHSRGSLMEIIDDLNLCLEQGYMTDDAWQDLRRAAESLVRQINGYIRYLQSKKSG